MGTIFFSLLFTAIVVSLVLAFVAWKQSKLLAEYRERVSIARGYFYETIDGAIGLSDYVEKSGHLLTIAKVKPKAVVKLPRALHVIARNAETGLSSLEGLK